MLDRTYSVPLYRFLINLAIVGILLALWWEIDNWISFQDIGNMTTAREAGALVTAVILLVFLGREAWANLMKRRFWLAGGGLLLMLAVAVAAAYFVLVLEAFRGFNLSGFTAY